MSDVLSLDFENIAKCHLETDFSEYTIVRGHIEMECCDYSRNKYIATNLFTKKCNFSPPSFRKSTDQVQAKQASRT